MKTLAIYAGTFDPITLGHLDLIERSAELFERLIVAVAVDTPKTPLFSLDERVGMVREAVQSRSNVEVESFDGLLIEYARRRKSRLLIRGLRAFSDFEYEFQMALTNRKLAPEIETVFMMPKEVHSYVRSSTVREVSRLGGNVSVFVPTPVQKALERRMAPHSHGKEAVGASVRRRKIVKASQTGVR
jgi:pantetheine-phosphate adenylyltransferase